MDEVAAAFSIAPFEHRVRRIALALDHSVCLLKGTWIGSDGRSQLDAQANFRVVS